MVSKASALSQQKGLAHVTADRMAAQRWRPSRLSSANLVKDTSATRQQRLPWGIFLGDKEWVGTAN